MTYPFGGAGQVWRDGEAGAYSPKKSEIRAWGAAIEGELDAGRFPSIEALTAATVGADTHRVFVSVDGMWLDFTEVDDAAAAVQTSNGGSRYWIPGTVPMMGHWNIVGTPVVAAGPLPVPEFDSTAKLQLAYDWCVQRGTAPLGRPDRAYGFSSKLVIGAHDDVVPVGNIGIPFANLVYIGPQEIPVDNSADADPETWTFNEGKVIVGNDTATNAKYQIYLRGLQVDMRRRDNGVHFKGAVRGFHFGSSDRGLEYEARIGVMGDPSKSCNGSFFSLSNEHYFYGEQSDGTYGTEGDNDGTGWWGSVNDRTSCGIVADGDDYTIVQTKSDTGKHSLIVRAGYNAKIVNSRLWLGPGAGNPAGCTSVIICKGALEWDWTGGMMQDGRMMIWSDAGSITDVACAGYVHEVITLVATETSTTFPRFRMTGVRTADDGQNISLAKYIAGTVYADIDPVSASYWGKFAGTFHSNTNAAGQPHLVQGRISTSSNDTSGQAVIAAPAMTRAQLVEWVESGGKVGTNERFHADDLTFRGAPGASAFADLPNLVPLHSRAPATFWGVVVSTHDDPEPDLSVAVANATKLQEAIDWCAANAVTLEIPGGVIWVAGYSIRKTGLVVVGQQGVDASVIKMHGAVHKNMPLSLSSIRGTVQSRITVCDLTFDANAARKDDVAQAATYGASVITFDSAAREAAFGTATDTMYGTTLIIGDQNDLDDGRSYYVRVRAKSGMRHSIDVTAPSSCRTAGDLAALGLPTGTATAYDPQPAKGIVLIDCFGTGAGDDNITTHHCSFVWMHRCIGYLSEGSRVPGNSNAVEIDDGSRNVWLMECAGIQCDGGLQIKGHNDAPAPYNIHVVGGFTAINVRYGLEIRHTGWYGEGTDSEDPPPLVDEEGNTITLTGASTTARNVTIDQFTLIAPRSYTTGGVLRPAERGVRIRSYENVQLGLITLSDGAVDLQHVADGYLPATTLAGPIFQVNGGASQVATQTLNTRGMADAPFGVRVYSTAGKGIKFGTLTMTDAPVSPFYVSGETGSNVSLLSYSIQGNWLAVVDSVAIRFSGPNFGGLGFGTVDGYNLHSTAPTLSRENTGPTMAYAGDLVINGEIITRTGAVSTSDLATEPITGFNAQWVENVQDLGAGEGRGYVWSVVLYDSGAEEHLPAQIVARTYAKKRSNTDTDATSDWWLQVSPDGTTVNLRDVFGFDAPTGQAMAPLGFKPGTTPGLPVTVLMNSVVYATNSTSEALLYSGTIPAGSLGPNGYLKIITLTSQSNNANSKTLMVDIAGTRVLNSTAGYTGSAGTRRETVIVNRNDPAVQIAAGDSVADDPGESTDAPLTYTINTAVDMALEIKGSVADGADSIALEYLIVEAVYRP